VTLFIDPPAWPAHGTVFSHLVSDGSLQELRLFARAAGVPDRAFDLDHYDVPAERYDELVTAGAVPVEGGDLARRLAGSGLRVSGAERNRAKRVALLTRWDGLWADPGLARKAGEELVDRWREPHRVYHTTLHLAAALEALDSVAAETRVSERARWQARLAVWFHDAVHDGGAARGPREVPQRSDDASWGGGGVAQQDEDRSAALVAELLGPLAGTGVSNDDVDEIARLVLVTADHDPAPDDVVGGLVSDADLAVLGGSPAAYTRYTRQVRAEYCDVPDPLFRSGRSQVLRTLLAGGPLFRTAAGAARWQAPADTNLRAELAQLAA
jgi:predicted metal-dependent HD superfamily phosphohydrolase